MARKNPVGKLAETALSTIMDPKGAAEKAVDQAKGTVALGKMAAGTATSTAASMAGSLVGTVLGKVAGRGDQALQSDSTTTVEPTAPVPLRSVPEVNEPAHTQPGTSKKADSPKKHGDVLADGTGTAATAKQVTKQAAPKARAVKPAADKAPAVKKSPAAKKSPAGAADAPTPVRPPVQDVATKKAVADAAAAKKAPTKKAAAKKTPAPPVSASPADVAEVVEAAVADDPTSTGAQPAQKTAQKAAQKPAQKTAQKTAQKAAQKTTKATKAPAKKAASGADDQPAAGTAPAKTAAKKSAAKKSPAKKSPAKKSPAKKASAAQAPASESPATNAPAKKAAPKTAADLAANEGDDITTPSGIPAVSEGVNPSTASTDLTQPGTEPVMDPSTVKQVASESDTLRKAAESNPE